MTMEASNNDFEKLFRYLIKKLYTHIILIFIILLYILYSNIVRFTGIAWKYLNREPLKNSKKFRFISMLVNIIKKIIDLLHGPNIIQTIFPIKWKKKFQYYLTLL